MLRFHRRKRKLSAPAVGLGVLLAAWIGRWIGPEMIRYMRVKRM